jgi:predicted nucleic acid-binding protein
VIVLDASAFFAAVLPAQATPASRAFFQTLSAPLTSPAILAVEARNVLLRFERRRLLSTAQCDEALSLLSGVTALQPWIGRDADMIRVIGLARQQGLSFFDALYLDCAMTLGAALATRDDALLAAANTMGVSVHDLR